MPTSLYPIGGCGKNSTDILLNRSVCSLLCAGFRASRCIHPWKISFCICSDGTDDPLESCGRHGDTARGFMSFKVDDKEWRDTVRSFFFHLWGESLKDIPEDKQGTFP